MAIKVLIIRRTSKEQVSAVQPYLSKLTSIALRQSGFISGKTLIRCDDSEEHLTICSWKSLGDWETFNKLQESKDLHYLIDQILVKPTQHNVYFTTPNN